MKEKGLVIALFSLTCNQVSWSVPIMIINNKAFGMACIVFLIEFFKKISTSQSQANNIHLTNLPFFLLLSVHLCSIPSLVLPIFYALFSIHMYLFFSWPSEPISNAIQRPSKRAAPHISLSRQRSL